MNIQSLSIVVPAEKCWNQCPFCVSRMHCEDYGEMILDNREPIPQEYLNRMQFVRDEGCNSMVITGDTEPQQNLKFIYKLLIANREELRTPFYNISLQTTGSGLNQVDIQNLAGHYLTTIALSVSSFNAYRNAEIIGMPEKEKRNLYDIQEWAKRCNLVTRASINLTSEFNDMDAEDYFKWARLHGFDQITFRRMYADGNTPQAQWIAENNIQEEKYIDIRKYIANNGTPIARLPFGFIKYSVHGISTVLDENCMSKNNIDEMKYAILRPNGHLYSRWDDPGSLIF